MMTLQASYNNQTARKQQKTIVMYCNKPYAPIKRLLKHSLLASCVFCVTQSFAADTTDVLDVIAGETVKVLHPVSLYDYNQAVSSYTDSTITGSFTGQNNTNPDKQGKKQQRSYNARVGLDYVTALSTENTEIKLDVNLAGSSKQEATINQPAVTTYKGDATLNFDKYLNPKHHEWFWYSQANASFTDVQGIKKPTVNAFFGMGHGRVVNVTAMATSIRIVEELIQANILKRTPTPQAYKNIARIVSKKAEYKSFYASDFTEYMLVDIEQALGTAIGARGALKTYNVLVNENISTRKYGWDTRIGLGLTILEPNEQKTKPIFMIERNYYYPFSNRSQFSNNAKVTTLQDFTDDKSAYTLSNAMKMTTEISNSFDWQNKWDINYTIKQNADNALINTLKSTLIYKFENALTLNLAATLVDIKDTATNKDNPELFFDTSLTYRLK